MLEGAYRTWHGKLFYRCCYYAAWCVFKLIFRLKLEGRENYPRDQGFLICSNHQSHLDPVLVGIANKESMGFVARESLFKFAPFRWLITYLGAVPIKRDGIGMAGLKETLFRLKNGESMLIFPEGTRTLDGQLKSFKNGFALLAQKTKVPIVPVAIEGAFGAWPRKQRLPKPFPIKIVTGPPIHYDEFKDLDADQLASLVESRVRSCWERACEL